MAVEMWAGEVAPAAYALALTAATTGGANLATVTGAQFVVVDPGGDKTTWTASYSYDGGTQTLTVTHTFAAGTSDLSRPGTWTIYAKLTVPGGFVRSLPRTITVHPEFYVG